MTLRRLAGSLAAVALFVSIVAILVWPAPDGDPEGPGRPSAGSARSPAGAAGAGDGGSRERGDGAEVVAGAGEAGGGAKVGFDTPEAAEAFVDRNVLEFLAVLAPEVDPADVSRTCTPDGQHCTFTGPWPGNDLLVRWIRAQGSGEATREDLEGVTFSRLKPDEDEAGQRIFVLEAHAPGENPNLQGDAR